MKKEYIRYKIDIESFKENISGLSNRFLFDKVYGYYSRRVHLPPSFELCYGISKLNLEFGVWTGQSIKILSKNFPNETFYGFDSFDGLPERWKISKKESYDIGHFALPNLPSFPKNVNLVKGTFEETIPKFILNHEMDVVNFLHIDCDLYSSTKVILEGLNEYISPNTVVRFDELVDWSYFGFPLGRRRVYENWRDGEFKALCEWLTKYDRIVELKSVCKQAATFLVIK